MSKKTYTLTLNETELETLLTALDWYQDDLETNIEYGQDELEENLDRLEELRFRVREFVQ